MILFITPYPNQKNEKDGMIQRVAAMDELFAGTERVYLDLRLAGRFRTSKQLLNPLLRVYQLNLLLHLPFIIYLGLKANRIYVHTVYNTLRVLPLYLTGKVITDMHGVVPEEMAYEGKRLKSLVLSLGEWVAIRFSRAVVTVTNQMTEHFRRKYPGARPRSFKVPIFNDWTLQEKRKAYNRQQPVIIYAGGLQRWQNVDTMLQTIKATGDKYRYIFLTGDLNSFRKRLAEDGLDKQVSLSTVPKDEIQQYYSQADFGFVLREDNLVNRVACPTKLVECLSGGVIPVVVQPNIGDFGNSGYACLTLEELLKGRLPSEERCGEMQQTNYKIMGTMKAEVARETADLLRECEK